MVSFLSMPGNHTHSLAYCFVFTNPRCPSCAGRTIFDWSDGGISMVFPLSMMSFDVVSSLKVFLYGAMVCSYCLTMYPFTMDCGSACICVSLHIAYCISLMVRVIGRQVCMMASMKFSVSYSKVLISLCRLLVCLER